MARIPLDPPRTLIYRLTEWYSRRRYGTVADPAAAMGHNPRVLLSYARFEMGVEKWHRLDPTLKALAEMAASVTIGCSWCVDFGYWLSMNKGVDPAKLQDVPRWRDSDVYTDLERKVLAYAEAASATPPAVTDEMVADLRRRLDDAAFVELTMMIAVENQRSRFNSSLGLTSQGFKDRCDIPARVGDAPRDGAVSPGAGGDLLAAFDRHRRLLFDVAYQMLGSVADAEDAVQDAWLRWSAADRGDVADPRAYLVRVVSRIALDRLTAARVRRETYVGPWLPEPLVTRPVVAAGGGAVDPAEAADVGEEVSLALLVVLESLSPTERAVFVLREAFGMSHTEVARALGRSEAAVRQMAHRAREHVQARRPRFEADRRETREVTERFLAACAGGDVGSLMAVLSPGVVLMTDGGGRTKAALRPIVGAEKVARFLLAVTPDGLSHPGLRTVLADVNGRPGVVVWADAGPLMAVSLVVTDGRVEQALAVLNPDKLAGIGAAFTGDPT